eukprot:c13428_g1_i2.p1 GENE.c13428_g1_i2~~c13428_g1_i2.p1  ORF type:complete len:467 (+),score=67.70 c13428_g1_i2:35-1402(+)
MRKVNRAINTIHFVQATILVSFIQESLGFILSINNSTKTYVFNTPPLSFGNLNFPVTVTNIIFLRGCSSLSPYPTNNNTLPDSVIFWEDSEQDEIACFQSHFVFECQKYSWCLGVISIEPFFSPSGFFVWSVFDKKRDVSEFQVPLVEMTIDDFEILKSAIKNSNYSITLTLDPNPYQAAFESIGFIFFFHVFASIWSFICFVISVSQIRRRSKKRKDKSGDLKKVCLILQVFTHVARFINVTVDPDFTQRIIPYLWGYISIYSCIAFELATNILLSFVIRELTRATRIIFVMKKVSVAYGFITVFLLLDLAISVYVGLRVNFVTQQAWIVKAFFYVIMNLLLGFWYLYEGIKFLRKCRRQNNINSGPRILLIRISILNSIGMILNGIAVTFPSIKIIFASPWGYTGTFMGLIIILQTTSFIQILLFSRATFTKKSFNRFMQRLSSIQRSTDISL